MTSTTTVTTTTTTTVAQAHAEVLLSTLPLTTVPPENYRFIPGSTILVNSTSTPSNITNSTIPNLNSPPFNGTGYFIEDEVEPGLSELQTLFLACIATFIPLIISLFAGFGIRMLWRKYRRYRECNNYDGDVLHREESSEPMTKPLCSHLLTSDQMKCSETQLSITADDMEICDGTTTISNGPQQNTNTRSTSHSSTNGSIITMTLKNNHLIVETEERNDLEEDSRETTMKYSPGARDGVFVVEVQQGSRRSPGSGGASVTVDPEPSVSISDQCALVHNPPDRYSDEETLEEGDEYYVETTSPSRDTPSSLHIQYRTGLTQSNSSLSSSSTQTYRYGNQQGYESGYYGYPICNGYNVSDEPIRTKIETTNKPKIISEIFKNRSDSKCGPLPDGFLLSDVMLNENQASGRKSSNTARTNTASNNKDEDVDPIQEEQNRLGNSIRVEAKVENVNEGGRAKEPKMSQKQIKHQITLDDSKKLEKLHQNDISSLSFDVKETDVRSAEYENKGFESTDLTKT